MTKLISDKTHWAEPSTRILIADSDRGLADTLALALMRANFGVSMTHDGFSALRRWRDHHPDLVILDSKLTGIDGLQVCRQIRSQSSTPIILLSVNGSDEAIVRGLEWGADDYLVKPCSPIQLVARCQAILRRAGMNPRANTLQLGGLVLDRTRRKVTRGGAQISLTQLEYRLLEALAVNVGQVISTNRLIDTVWGPNGGDKIMLKQLVHRLRRKIELDPLHPLIETIAGTGYALIDYAVQHAEAAGEL